MGRAYQYQEEERAIIRKHIEQYLRTNERQCIDLGDVVTYFDAQDGFEVVNYVDGDDQTFDFGWNYLESAVIHIEERIRRERLRRAKVKRIKKTAKHEGWSSEQLFEAIYNA